MKEPRMNSPAEKQNMELLARTKRLLRISDRKGLEKLFIHLEPADAREVLRALPEAHRLALLLALRVEYAVSLFQELEEEEQEELLTQMEGVRLGLFLDKLDPDERADLLGRFSAEERARFFALMDRREAEDARRLVGYPADTAGGRMTTDYAVVCPEVRVQEALESLRRDAGEVETIYYVYVVDHAGILVGMVSLKDLVLADQDAKVSGIMHRDIIAVPVEMDQERVAREYVLKYDYLALPVVSTNGEMLGIITYDDVMDVIREENTEDMHRFGAAGIEGDYLSSRIVGVAGKRLVWLVFLVVASFFSVMVMDAYSNVLGSVIALTFFIPLLMNSAGNAGTQAATVAVRGLATGELRITDIWSVARKELMIGMTVGAALGVCGLLRALLLDASPALGYTVGITMVVSVIVSTTIGGALPFVFKRLGFDPALMSGPLLTTIVDISTLAIYFNLARCMIM